MVGDRTDNTKIAWGTNSVRVVDTVSVTSAPEAAILGRVVCPFDSFS